MNKTIEEVSKRFADMKTTKQAGSSVERDKKALLMTQFFHFALEELPLSSRLTTEEKEMVRTKYNGAKIGATEFDSPECADLMDILERIFGAEMFDEKEK